MTVKYDILVVGGGHAGCEAAYIAAKMADSVLLITGDKRALGRMSCNPAMGGLAKGQLVKEIDALGGIMGEITDLAGVQFRLLNRSKGPAVRSTRVQCDRKQYEYEMLTKLNRVENLEIIENMITDVIIDGNKIIGVKTGDGLEICGKAIIITAGTFLNGITHVGFETTPAGRYGEKPAVGLTEKLNALGIKSGRLKTGTPPRIDGNTIDFEKTKIQYGDNPAPLFSCRSDFEIKDQMTCYLTYTNEKTHEIIRGGIDRSPLFRGIIQGIGPRYCPSIEDKVVRFEEKSRHQLFLEPEGRDNDEYYLNGFSSSLPEDIQYRAMKTIPGLEEARMNRPGYAIEYDYFPSSQIKPTMESKIMDNLYFAGQVNGTSGYEEAGAQGVMAGINAVLKIRKEEPFVLKRSEAYIGVLIDDLTTRDIDEPYRLFTSRAEYRLMLREDNARDRLGAYARKFGLISDGEYKEMLETRKIVEKEKARLSRIFIFPAEIERVRELREDPERKLSLAEALKIPGVTEGDICGIDGEFAGIPARIRYKVETEIKYEGYIARQLKEIERFGKYEDMRLDERTDYLQIKGLKREAAEKLEKFKPYSLGQASRIAGVSPGDISVLLVHVKRMQRANQGPDVSRETSKNR
ncbi:MAG: tRNA uridine-5-carboxymethylaminomethyl(34) synthesis enzyme MnmG [candidate division Zixibacteria bacterium]|nr:tRNA uridine-5-carboxymethylaminomethyl(34) synthesis enzyme MnmG [candidate division Zixibacteria bacterium]